MGKNIRKIFKLILLENPKKDENKLSAPVRIVTCHIRNIYKKKIREQAIDFFSSPLHDPRF
jgi:hypothetical protein